MPEIELRVLSRQCLDRRVRDLPTSERAVAAGQDRRDAQGGAINRRVTTADARIKLTRLYPSVAEQRATGAPSGPSRVSRPVG